MQAPSKISATVAAPAAAVRKAPAASKSPAEVLPLDPASTRSLVIVMHGKRADEPGLRNAILGLKAEGHQISVRCTFDAGDADAFVAESLRLHNFSGRRALTIMAAGGDGTVNEVACAMLKHGAPRDVGLAVLPLGTANDFASALGISMDPAVALRVALDPSSPRLVDVGLVNGHPFLNVALAGGVSAVPQEELSSPLKRALGPLGIAIHVLKRLVFEGLPPTKGVTIKYPLSRDAPLSDLDDETRHATITGDLLVLAAGQSRQMGRAVSICPDALLDDGLLDFTLALGHLRERARELVSDARARGIGRASGGVRHVAVPWLEVTAPEGVLIPVNRDGEPEDASTRLLFEILPKRLLVHMPDDRLLVSGSPDRGAESDLESEDGEITSAEKLNGHGKAGAAHRHNHNHSHSHSHNKKKRPVRVRRAALRKLMRIVQPEGRELRLHANLRAAARKAASTGLLLGLGFIAGVFFSGRRREAEQRRQQEEEEARRRRLVSHAPFGGKGARSSRRGGGGGSGGGAKGRGWSAVLPGLAG